LESHAVEFDAVVAAWLADPDPAVLSPAVLRLSRRVASLRPSLDALLQDPLERALAGLEPPPTEGETLGARVLAMLALVDGGALPTPAEAEALEAEAQGDPEWWVPAARIHVLTSEPRERAARMALSDQDLPYVFPGELHPLMVETLAVGDRALTALHVDWMRKLSGWVVDALVLDLRCSGLWFWPHLRFLSEKRLALTLRKLVRLRRGRPGSRGLVVAYHHKVGAPWEHLVAGLEPVDAFHAAVAMASDRPS
jgi:hypothetical protein